jgi:cholesterol oxidase
MVDPDHEGGAQGWVGCDALGGRLPVERGVFNLFVNQADPADKRMLYQLWFHDGEGRALTLAGHKVVEDHPGFDLWSDTTTLFTRIVDGHVAMPDAEAASPVGAGIIRISPAAFARQLTTFRSTGPSASGRIAGLFRFGRLFFGSLWDVYAREVLSSSPF